MISIIQRLIKVGRYTIEEQPQNPVTRNSFPPGSWSWGISKGEDCEQSQRWVLVQEKIGNKAQLFKRE
jgi:hypothetical protein